MFDKIKKILCKGKCQNYITADELRSYGAIVGCNFSNYGKIDLGHAYLLEIGNNVTLSDCRILLHDASTKMALGYTKIGYVKIGDNVFIGADAIVLPNVKIGSNCIIGAGSIVNRDIPSGSVVAGNPAKIIGQYTDFINKNKELMSKTQVYTTYWKNKTIDEKNKERNETKKTGISFDI